MQILHSRPSIADLIKINYDLEFKINCSSVYAQLTGSWVLQAGVVPVSGKGWHYLLPFRAPHCHVSQLNTTAVMTSNVWGGIIDLKDLLGEKEVNNPFDTGLNISVMSHGYYKKNVSVA